MPAQHAVQRSEVRKDYLHDSYVIIAPRRAKRPGAVDCPECRAKSTPRDCVFCPGNIDPKNVLATVGPGKRWRMKVLKNVFPAVTPGNPKAFGRQEVIIETPEHDVPLERLPEEAVAELLAAYGARVDAATKDRRVRYVMAFKNTNRAGASLPHAHSQVFALGFVPPLLAERSRLAAEHRARTGTCPYCDVLRKEEKGPRRVFADAKTVAFAPYASMHNHELWLMPRRHVAAASELDAAERLSLARALKAAVGVVTGLGLPYNLFCHRIAGDDGLHFFITLAPRGSVWAGVEIGSGVIINPVAPEDAAARYRKALGRR